MLAAYREAELTLYWRTVHSARQIIRDDPRADISSHKSDLDAIAFHTEWPRLKEATALAVDSLTPPLTVDLTVFDLWPEEIADLEQAR